MSDDLPTGTVTFLFTDIAGSTELWELDPEHMPLALVRHEEVMRGAIERHHGHVFATAGDSFAAAFHRPIEGLGAAIDAQLDLRRVDWECREPIRVRMGLHVGEADERDGDYFGRDVNLAARVAAAGHGGQILVSEVLVSLVREVELIDLGEHHLAGIEAPHRLFQVTAGGLRREFPAPRAARGGTNLPFPADPFVGRASELKEVRGLLAEHRLVSLVGTGGAGKTRLAVEAARTQLDEHRDGVWFVDLTPVTDEHGVVRVIAEALAIGETPARRLDRRLTEELADRRLLLVVDNCEHIVEIAAGTVAHLLSNAQHLHVLTTTREALGVAGEAVGAVGPLAVPEVDDRDRVLESDAVQLFLSRARDAAPSFVGNADELGDVVRICRAVDGLPLAIELAAARLRVVSVTELAVRLTTHLGFLGTARWVADDRHRTIEAVVAWSYGLLTSEERVVLQRLGVFSGGFTLEAAEELCGWGAIDRARVVDLALGLVDKSLVQRVEGCTGSRYRMLETIRDFARARLAEQGELDPARDRHLAWAMGLISELEAAMRTEAQDATLAAVVDEHDNLRIARTRAIEVGDAVAALRITASAPVDANATRGPLLAQLIDEGAAAPPSVLVRARYACMAVAFECGDNERGAEHGRAAIALYRDLGDQRQEAYATMMHAFCRWGLGQPDIDVELTAAAAIFDELDDPMGRAYVHWTRGQWKLEHDPDDPDIEHFATRAVELFASIGAAFGLAHAQEGLAYVRLRERRPSEALSLIVPAMRQFHQMGGLGCLGHTIDAAAMCMAERGDLEEAATLLGAAQPMFERAGAVHRPWEIEAYDRLVRRLSAELPPAAFEQARARGAEMTVDEAVERVDHLSTTS